ncbi:CD209 antigen-like protein E [Mytilus trossulus]|uniref:CD209 antigen-like protein E n=1 Tax=Mytilus trossulus TaxID=6551 RepID=UPI003003E4D3
MITSSCFYILLVWSATSSLATEKNCSEESSNKSTESPCLWMMIKQIVSIENRFNEFMNISNHNKIAINKIVGKLEKDEDIKTKVKSLEDCCKKQKAQITSLASNVGTQKRECRSIQANQAAMISLLKGNQNKMMGMQLEINNLKKKSFSCPDDWVTFSGHCYWFVYRNVTWNIAKKNCQQKGGYLAKVDSGAENSWLISKLQAEVWIGLNDIETEGQWRWTSDNTGISSSYWQYPEPNGERTENCVNFCKKTCQQKAYGWNDLPCDYPTGYVCEKQP